MRLVFLYGPPGAGKLTVARELSSTTGIPVFHNHLTVDCVASVFQRGSPSFDRLISQFRRDVFAEAVSAGVDLIFTYVYAHPTDHQDVLGMTAPVLAGGGSVRYVQLSCAPAVLLERVQAASRRAFGKLADPAVMRQMLETFDLATPIPDVSSLRLDTTNLPPAAAAARIVAHYALPTVAPE
jgi:hypothetical protein